MKAIEAKATGTRRPPYPCGWLLASLAFAGALLGCGPSDPEPPVPVNLAEFDPLAAARINEALAHVRADPRRAQVWADLGATYLSEHLKDLAIQCLRVAEELKPGQPKWPYHVGVMLARTGALEEAGAALQRSIDLEPGYAPSHARLGKVHFDLGDLDAAERSFRRATELDSTYPGGWVGLARVELQRDHVAEAIAILERLAREDPDSRTFRQLLATARRQLDPSTPLEPESVLADEELQVWNDPWALEARAFTRVPVMLQINLLLEQGDPSGALALLQEERAQGRDENELAPQFALAYMGLGQAEEASRELDALLARQPDNVRALILRAGLFEKAGNHPEVARMLTRLTVALPGNGRAFARLADKLAQLGQFEPAVTAYQRALDLGLSGYELRLSFGNCLMALRRWSQAIQLFEVMLRERPDDGDTWLQLALARLRSGLLDEAAQAIERGRTTGKARPRLVENVSKALDDVRARRAALTTPREGDG